MLSFSSIITSYSFCIDLTLTQSIKLGFDSVILSSTEGYTFYSMKNKHPYWTVHTLCTQKFTPPSHTPQFNDKNEDEQIFKLCMSCPYHVLVLIQLNLLSENMSSSVCTMIVDKYVNIAKYVNVRVVCTVA